MATATFKHYDRSNSEAVLQTHDGERAEIIEEIPLDHEEFVMFKIRFADGVEAEAFDDELTDRKDS